MKRVIFGAVSALCILTAQGGFAQDTQTLADIRQEAAVLSVEITKLTRELSTPLLVALLTLFGASIAEPATGAMAASPPSRLSPTVRFSHLIPKRVSRQRALLALRSGLLAWYRHGTLRATLLAEDLPILTVSFSLRRVLAS